MKCQQKKNQYANVGGQLYEKVRITCDSQLSRFDEGPDDLVCQKKGSRSPATEARTNHEKDDEWFLARNSSVLNEFLNIPLQSIEAEKPTDCIGAGQIASWYIVWNQCH